MKRFILYLIFISLSFGELLQPEDGNQLNYIHVLFEWEQEPDAVAYRIEISTDSNFSNPEVSHIDSSLIYIETEMVEWQTTYYWRVAPLNQNGTSDEWIDTRMFSTGETISNAEATIYNENLYSNGLTIFGAFYDYYSAIIDKTGKEIWNSEEQPFIFYNTDYYGQFYGCEYISGQPDGNFYKGVKFSLDNEIIWEEPNDEFNHHDIIQLPNGNYLGIVEVEQLGPVPIGDWTPICYQYFGALCDGVTPFFIWFGDKLVEWDEETKEVLWEWNFFDHLSMDDYDIENGTWFDAFVATPQRYDWTHANALWFDETESAVYVAIRHLSRIVKIHYPSGEIIWSMGENMPSGDAGFGHDLGFNFQHCLQILENGNILTFDNGNLSFQSRALEIQVNEVGGDYSADIVWEHNLPSELYGSFSGNVQKLDNGNYLITTIGESGTSLEISPDHETIWEAKYHLSEPLGAVYRSNRISGLYPSEFSISVNGLTDYNSESAVLLPIGTSNLNFTLTNEGSNSESFEYALNDEEGWFVNQTGSVFLENGESQTLSFQGNIWDDPNPHNLNFSIIPIHRNDLAKTIDIQAYSIQCGEEFTFISDIPPSITIWPADSCFYTNDLLALEDVISENELNSYTSPLEMGTQTWINGRLKNWVADYNFSGSGLTEPISILPESIGNWTELSYLALQWNNLTEIPEALGQLTGLSSLYISNNQLGGLPESIGNLTNLYFLDLGYNQIESIPESFCDLTNLSYLWLFNNLLSAMPECICNLNIDWSGIDGAWYPYFAIGGNYLCENLPECISNSEHLNTSLDQFIYSFMVEDPQNCDSLEVVFQTDWNLIGLPLEVEDPYYTAVFPNAIPGTLYLFDGTYTQTQELINGTGYWLRFDEQAMVTITGNLIQELSINLATDWNLISGISEVLEVSQITDPDNILIPGTFYGFEDTYNQVSQLEPGKGYWVRTNNSGEILLSASLRTTNMMKIVQVPEDANTIKYGDQILYFGNNIEVENPLSYSLPPKPLAPSTDIRFLGDTKLCSTDECVIEVMNPNEVFHINYDLQLCDNLELSQSSVSCGWKLVNEKTGKEYSLSGNGSIKITGNVSELILRKSTSLQTPTEYSLFPAHPNPFNPVTTIRFSVPVVDTKHTVSLRVYDITGKLVETLVDEKLTPGNHSVNWNAVGFSSGMYFIFLEGDGKRQIQKVVLMK